MTTRRSPTIRRRRLGMELRQFRDAADLTIERVAKTLGCSDSRVSRIETGQVGASPEVVGQMLDLYKVTGERRAALMHLARVAQEKGWWQAYSDAPVVPVVGLEAEAASIRIYEASLVPGLFQTAGYAKAMIRRVRPLLSAEQIERWVDLRLTRQQALFSRQDPPVVTAVIDEAVLRRPVGGAEVMRQQLNHLAGVAARPWVTVQVLEFSTGEHAAMSGPFTIFGFSESLGPDVVYFEHITSDLYLDHPADVERYGQVFDELCESALAADDSRARVAALAASPGTHAGRS